MSQQINLLLPELRPRFDWLDLRIVAGAALGGLVLVLALSMFGAARVERLKAQEEEIGKQLLAAQQQIQGLGQALTARQADASLGDAIATARLAVTERQEVLALIAQGEITQANAYSGLLQGFARQTLDGVWLSGFVFAGKAIDIQGRLLDPALLPTYINRLNNEPAFAGRRFAALDMKSVDPADEKGGAASSDSKPRVAPARFTEFALRTEMAGSQEKAQ